MRVRWNDEWLDEVSYIQRWLVCSIEDILLDNSFTHAEHWTRNVGQPTPTRLAATERLRWTMFAKLAQRKSVRKNGYIFKYKKNYLKMFLKSGCLFIWLKYQQFWNDLTQLQHRFIEKILKLQLDCLDIWSWNFLQLVINKPSNSVNIGLG